jgi:hypothetical protein
VNRFLVSYYQDNVDIVKVNEVAATTEQSAQNKFEQMYHNCQIIKIEEVKDES